MPQDSPAKPLLDLRQKMYSAADKFLSYDKPIGKKSAAPKEDTSWHDGMVKQANEAFRKSAVTGAKPTQNKPATKKKMTKKVSAKR